jgi:hypothetical protein
MKKLMILGVALVLTATLAGCGGGSDAIVVSPAFVSVSGDAASDGYIEDNVVSLVVSLTAFQNDGIRAQSPLGISFERRGFVSFPITLIPVASLVESAQVRLFVTNVVQDVVGTPVSLDVYHVFYGSPLLASDFLTPRAFVTTFLLIDSDAGNDLPPFDFSPELQSDVDDPTHGFFQLMLIARNGVVEIEDSENSLPNGFLPLLDASYFP